jgi:hypothetical protein
MHDMKGSMGWGMKGQAIIEVAAAPVATALGDNAGHRPIRMTDTGPF